MKNKVKTFAVLLAAVLSLSLLAVFTGVSAEDDAEPAEAGPKGTEAVTEQVDESEETGMGVLIHYADGRTEESVFVPDAENPYGEDSERVLEGYDPLGLDGQN